MKGFRLLFVFVLSLFEFTSYVSADMCDNEHIKQLKKLADDVSVSYEYIDYSEEINSGNDGEYPLNLYSISVGLLSDELYINNGYNDYFYNDSISGIVNFNASSGNVNFTIHSSRCNGYKLKTVSLNLPKFNAYSYRSECKELEEYELDICDPWYQGILNDKLFYKEVNKYLKNDVEDDGVWNSIVVFFQKYQLIIVGSLCLIFLGIIGYFSYRKRSVLD